MNPESQFFNDQALLSGSNIAKALENIDKYLYSPAFNNKKDFFSSLSKNNPKNVCTVSWNNGLSFNCSECSMNDNSCVCLECYLNGNHKDHFVMFSISGCGNCDCGDPNFWKPSGYCCNHGHIDGDPDLLFLSAEEREKFLGAFRFALSLYIDAALTNDRDFDIISKWINEYIELCDSVRRCVAIAFKELFESNNMIDFYISIPKESMENLLHTFGSIISDPVFLEFSSKGFISNYPSFLCEFLEYNGDHEDFAALKQFSVFSFHFFSQNSLKLALTDSFIWLTVITSSIGMVYSKFITQPSKKLLELFLLADHIDHISDIVKHGVHLPYDQNIHESCGSVIDDLVIDNEFEFRFKREMGEKKDDDEHRFIAFHLFSNGIFRLIDSVSLFRREYMETFLSVYQRYKNSFDLSLTCDNDDQSLYGTPLCPAVYSSISPLISVLLYSFIKKNSEDIYSEISQRLSIDKITLIKVLLAYPLRFFATVYFSFLNVYVRNSEDTNIACISVIYKGNPDSRFLKPFGFIQHLFASSNNKSGLLEMVLSIFGMYQSNNEFRMSSEFSLLIMIGALVFDRMGINNNPTKRRIDFIIAQLINGPCLLDELMEVIGSSKDVPVVLKFLGDVTETHDSHGKISISLKNNIEWNPYLFFYRPNLYLTVLTKYISRKDRIILPPKMPSDEFSRSLSNILVSPVLYAFMFNTIHNIVNQSTDSHLVSGYLVISLLIAASSISMYDSSKCHALDTISVNNYKELYSLLPTDFYVFMHTPISLNGNKPINMIDMIIMCPSFPKAILEKLNINTSESSNSVNSDKERLKNEAKRRALASLKTNIIDPESIEEEPETCNICYGEAEEPLCYPGFISRTLSGPLLLRIGICPHLVHPSCVQKSERGFICPVDRTIMRFLLPSCHTFSAVSESTMLEYDFFLGYFAEFNEAFEVFIGEIDTLSRRSEESLACLSYQPTILLLNQFFKALFHLYHRRTCSFDFNNESPLPLIVFIILKSDNPVEAFPSIIEKYRIISQNPAEISNFCMCLAIIQLFVLEIPFPDEDFHVVFEPLYLLSFYKYPPITGSIENFITPSFEFPHNFFELFSKPFNIEFSKSINQVINVFTGERFSFPGSPLPKIRSLEIFIRFEVSSLYLIVGGENIGSCMVTIGDKRIGLFVPSFYVNQLGVEDRGLHHGLILYLSKERLRKAIDRFLALEYMRDPLQDRRNLILLQ